MKKTPTEDHDTHEDDMLPEYDFTGGVKGKHRDACAKGYAVKVHKADCTVSVRRYTLEDATVTLAPDVREYFPDSDSVNEALRSLIKIVPKKRKTA